MVKKVKKLKVRRDFWGSRCRDLLGRFAKKKLCGW